MGKSIATQKWIEWLVMIPPKVICKEKTKSFIPTLKLKRNLYRF